MSRDPDSLSGDFAPPKPPHGVKDRTLTAAREAMCRPEPTDVWTRIWGSRTLQFAWAVSVGCLLFGHVVLNQSVRAGSAIPAMPLAAVVEADDELIDIAALPRQTAHLPGFEIAPRMSNPTPDEPDEYEETS